jgi:hypothetical protein
MRSSVVEVMNLKLAFMHLKGAPAAEALETLRTRRFSEISKPLTVDQSLQAWKTLPPNQQPAVLQQLRGALGGR